MIFNQFFFYTFHICIFYHGVIYVKYTFIYIIYTHNLYNIIYTHNLYNIYICVTTKILCNSNISFVISNIIVYYIKINFEINILQNPSVV